MKQTLLLVVLLFTAASAPCQTNTGLVPGDPTYQQQFDSESGNHANQREVLNKLQSRIQDNHGTEGGAN